jgi:DNA-binding winged helix-turn-helix (wHTH) protein/Flp pilus assembly protein TadD/predicted negative regulator of RcsB-dependent stress response
MPVAAHPIYRFGEFEVDSRRRTLKRGDVTVSLNRRSFDLLLYFVQNSGRVLGKDELLKEIWPDTFVDENSLAKSISVLRKALDENPLESTLVVTVPGRGYQFAGAVELAGPLVETDDREFSAGGGATAIGVVVRQRTITTRIDKQQIEEQQTGEGQFGRQRTGPRGWFAFSAGALVAAVLAGGGGYLLWRHFHPAPLSASVVLAEFENTTGDKDFDYALSRAFQIELEQSPFLDILPRATVEETLVEMHHSADEALTPELAREVCERNNAQAVLEGAISNFDNKYLLLVNATSCVSGKNLAGYKQLVSSKSDALPALDAAAGRMRKQLGESSGSLERFQMPIAQATTPSLEALRAYTQALDSSDRGDIAAEQALFKRAIALDPNFASAYKGLSMSYHSRGDLVQAVALIQKAYALRAGTTERERLSIEIAYNTFGSGDWEAAIDSMRLYNQIYPNDAANWISLCYMYNALGEYAEAIEAGEQALRLAPHSGAGAEVLAQAYMRANRFADAKRVAELAIAEGKDRRGAHRVLFQIAYVERDAARMKTEGEWGFTHGEMGQSLTDLGFVAASEGKLREAVDDFTRARQEAIQSGDADFADDATMFLAGIEEQDGYPREAAATLKQMQSDAYDPGTTAEFKAELGDLIAAQQKIVQMENSHTANTMALYFDLPMLRATIDMKNHRAADAVRDLEPAQRYQMRDYGVPLMRARAEAEAGMLDKAAEDYQLVLANPGLDPIWPGHSLAHLYLAQVLARQNKLDQAQTEYRAFLEIWKDADPQIPLLTKAKQDYAQIQSRR